MSSRGWVLLSFVLLTACQASATPGASCASASDCGSPLVCRLGRCRVECTMNRDCTAPARCLLDPTGVGSCSLDTDERCESGGHACPTGLICVGDRCANSCRDMHDCPPDAMCRPALTSGVMFCFDPDREDAGPTPGDGGHDAFVPIDAAPDAGPSCALAGAVGATCDGTTCQGAECMRAAHATVQTAFGLVQEGALDTAHPGYVLPRMPTIPANDAPFNGFASSFCAQQCDLTATIDGCGSCATCSQRLTQMPLFETFGGALSTIPIAMRSFGNDTGECRIDCTWSATGRSAECPDLGFACDAAEQVCIDACTSDEECNTRAVGVTYEGRFATALEVAHPRHCNAATGRCEIAGSASATVGTACTGEQDCPSNGVCLPGGRCAAYDCSGIGTTCAAGTGVCVAASSSSHARTLCVIGCNAPADCGAGHTCHAIGATVGSFTGVCRGRCASDDECGAHETCTDGASFDLGTSPNRCVPRCDFPGQPGNGTAQHCAVGAWCRPDHAGAAYGWCEPLDGFCGSPGGAGLVARQPDCADSQVCDELLVTGDQPDGHCIDPCVSCAGGAVCVASGPLTGLCRVPCTTSCAAGTCDTTLGYCVE